MVDESLQAALRGVNFVTATPFTGADGDVNTAAIKRNVRGLVDAGADVIIPCGGVGEYYSLSADERVDVVEATVDAVAGNARVLGGVGGPTRSAIELVEEYAAVGADGVMLMFPQRPSLHRDGLVLHYRAIVESTELGVMLYKKDHRLDAQVLGEIATHENVIAVKHAVGDINAFVKDVNDVQDDLVWIDGNAEVPAVSFGVEGADGFTTGIGNFVPELPLALMDAIHAGNWTRARRLRELARPFQELRGAVPGSTGVGVVKHGMDVAGFEGGPVRPPLHPMAPAHQTQVEELYDTVVADLEAVAA